MQYVDLFCGIGAFAAGAVQWGLVPVLAIDSDDEALDIFRNNFDSDETQLLNMFLGRPGHEDMLYDLIERVVGFDMPWHLHASPPRHLVGWTLELIKRLNPISWSLLVKSNRANKVALRKYSPRRWMCGGTTYLYAGTTEIPYAARMAAVGKFSAPPCTLEALPEAILAIKGFPDWFEIPNKETFSDMQLSRVLIGSIYPQCGELIAISVVRHFFPEPDDDDIYTSALDDADADGDTGVD